MDSSLTIKMKDVPKSERPRERLLTYGESHLSNQEILAILIGSGTRSESVLDLSNRLIMHFEGLKLLSDATIEELTSIKGIGNAKGVIRSEEHTSELQSRGHLVCRLLL